MMKYLFECHFNDGTVLQQTEADVSTVDSTRSAFYDVMQRSADIIVFGIYNDQNTYAVDLRDGSFLVNGAKFSVPAKVVVATLVTATDCDPKAELQSLDFEAQPDQKYELVYFRRHSHVTVMGASDVPEELSHRVEYHLGWSTLVDGTEVRQTICVS